MNKFLADFKTSLFKPTVVIDNTSPKGKLNQTDYAKLATHVVIGMALAALPVLAEHLSKVDFGSYTIFVLPLLTAAYQASIKYLKDHDPQVEGETNV